MTEKEILQRVLPKHRKGGDILTCGFPANQLDMVLQRIRDAGGEVEQTAEKTFLFRGLDGQSTATDSFTIEIE